jgi:hypothetical protein|nr:hypothetical protein [uncultured Prevotella sp.]
MRTLYITILLIALMALAIPLHDKLAVSPTTPTYTHLVYMFGHAGFIHWAVNSWCILMLHHQFKPHRVIASWLGSVVLSFLYYPSLPVLGASVIISFFMGITSPWLYRYKRLAFWQMVVLLAIGCVLPHIAGTYHLVLFAFGFLYAKVESFIHHANNLKI